VLIPASALAVVSGVLLVIDSDVWGFGDDWIVLGIVLFAITFLAGALFFGPNRGASESWPRPRGRRRRPCSRSCSACSR
jgi:hypothetical protein